MEKTRDILKGYVDLILISILRKEAMYGYKLAKEIRYLTNDKFELNEATLYVALKRMEKISLVESYWGDLVSGGGRRKYYKLTNSGKIYLEKMIEEWKFFKNIIDQVLEGDVNDQNN